MRFGGLAGFTCSAIIHRAYSELIRLTLDAWHGGSSSRDNPAYWLPVSSLLSFLHLKPDQGFTNAQVILYAVKAAQ